MHASACWCVALGGLLLATSSVADAQSTHTRSLRHRGPAPKRGPELASDADFAALFSDSHPSDGNSGNYGDQSPGSYAIPPVAPPPSLDPGPSPGAPSADAPPPTALPQAGDLRIVDRLESNGFVSGALQVFIDGAFGAVCASNFGAVDADVACKQLGFVGGAALPLAIDRRLAIGPLPEEVEIPLVLESISCAGNEARLVDCSVGEDVYDYPYSIDYDFSYYERQARVCNLEDAPYAYVACGTITDQEPGDLRLRDAVTSDDGSAQYGRLQVFGRGGWGTVCDPRPPFISRFDAVDQEIDQATINIACGELGFSSGVKTQLAISTTSRAERRNPILLGGLFCEGDEIRLLDCPGAVIGEGSRICGVAETLSVICFNNLDPSREDTLRLVEGEETSAFAFGRLEIFLNSFWGNICDLESFTPDAALVACRILGYDGGIAIKEFVDAPGATVGFSDQVSENLPVALANVDCDGDETSLLQCSSSPPDIRRCILDGLNATDGTVLACANTDTNCPPLPPPTEGSLRLSGGFGTPCDQIYTGFVEIFHDGEWGAICLGTTSFFHQNAAAVVCRQLGFPHGTRVDPSINPAEADRDILVIEEYAANFALRDADEAEEPIGRYWLSRTDCEGTEEQLLDCDLAGGFIATNAQNARCFVAAGESSRYTVECRMFPLPGTVEAPAA